MNQPRVACDRKRTLPIYDVVLAGAFIIGALSYTLLYDVYERRLTGISPEITFNFFFVLLFFLAGHTFGDYLIALLAFAYGQYITALGHRLLCPPLLLLFITPLFFITSHKAAKASGCLCGALRKSGAGLVDSFNKEYVPMVFCAALALLLPHIYPG